MYRRGEVYGLGFKESAIGGPIVVYPKIPAIS